ncbi:hypothetical protein FQN54_004155 [Arachnomyces sp. PD_36]|nr:hypothetical protein FQN54_004155 [Arachnomyces sp. PD_36]
MSRRPNDHVSTKQQSSKQGEESQGLASFLDRQARGDLTLLISDITESMRKVISDNFDASTAALDEQRAKDKENSQGENREPSRAEADASPLDNGENRPGMRPREASASSLREVKAEAEALRYFNEWRDSVILRVGEAVNKEETEKQQGESESQKDTGQGKSSSDAVPSPEQLENDSRTLRYFYHPTDTPLSQLPIETKMLILHSLLLLLLSLEHYSAHSRVLLLNIASSLGLSMKMLVDDEIKVARGLLEAAKEMSGDEETKKKVEQSSMARKWKVGLASVGGAVLIGVTGGLAAPLIAAGIGTVMGGLGLGATAAAGLLGTVAGSGVIIGGIFGAYGGRMTGKMMDQYAREVEDFAFIPNNGSRTTFRNDAEAAQQDRRLRVTIGISGWLTEEDDVVVPWKVIGQDSEVFALRWELEALMRLGNAMTALVTSAAWVAGKEVLSKTILAQLMSAVALPFGLLQISRIVDNPFSVAKSRADKAGEVLADALINKAQGERPVTLIGYSLGARVIFSCLRSLARRRAYGLVETAILMGAPTPSSTHHWRMMRTVVSGRLVNVYSENDTILKFLYRTSSIQLGVAGLQDIEGIPGVESIDVSSLISGHLRYRYLIGTILLNIGFQDIDLSEVRREERALRIRDEEEERERAQHEEQRHKADLTEEGRAGPEDSERSEAVRLEKQVEQRTRRKMMNREMEKMKLEGGEKQVERKPLARKERPVG